MDASCEPLPALTRGRSDAPRGLSFDPPASAVSTWCGPARRRLRIGETNVEVRDFPRQRATQPLTSTMMVVLLVPLAGGVEVITESSKHSVGVGQAILLARDEAATAVWLEASRGLVLNLPRVRLQAIASEQIGDARRLAGVNLELAGGEGDDSLTAALRRFVEAAYAEPEALGRAAHPIETPLLKALVQHLREAGPLDDIFPIARSVMRAADYVRAHSQRPCMPEELAAVAGVTSATLRQNFRACLGMSVGAFVQSVRLDLARAQLMSGQDSRPVSVLAIDAGFSSGGVFSRAYQRRFGEIPSQTRARAVRAPRGDAEADN